MTRPAEGPPLVSPGDAPPAGTRAPHAGGIADLVVLAPDHPGFSDAGYRGRRHAIAQAALDFAGGEAPRIDYTEAEHATWRAVWRALEPLHEEWAPRGYLALNHRLGLDRNRIPQMADVNPRLRSVTGFEWVVAIAIFAEMNCTAAISGNVSNAVHNVA